MIRKIAIILIAILLGLTAWHFAHQPKPKPPVVHHKPPVAQVTHGIKPPYNWCVPNETGTIEREHQDQILVLEKQMEKYNDVPDNVDNPDYQQIKQAHDQMVAEYDTCTMVYN